tara:strand:+ start:3648 stop:3953 length:306 start_codon:yes stop_codon:yes gene_type:complete
MKKQCLLTPYPHFLSFIILAVSLIGCEAVQKAQEKRNERLMTDLQKSVQNRPADSAPSPDSPAALIGKTAPDFTLRTIAGDTVSLSDLRGKAVVLNFWATW